MSQQRKRPVEAILLSGNSSAGKSYVLDLMSRHEPYRSALIYEMDWLRYWQQQSTETQLPVALDNFRKRLSATEPSALVDELRANIENTEGKRQLIKLQFFSLMADSRQLVSVLPQAVRHRPEDQRFFDLLEGYFERPIVRVAVIPTIPRLLVNLFHRRKLLDRTYVKYSRDERSKHVSKSYRFDCVLRISMTRSSDEDLLTSLESQLEEALNAN